jgi:hypothetical protein
MARFLAIWSQRQAFSKTRAELDFFLISYLITCHLLAKPNCILMPQVRVARWFVFKPKIPNFGKFWRAFEW